MPSYQGLTMCRLLFSNSKNNVQKNKRACFDMRNRLFLFIKPLFLRYKRVIFVFEHCVIAIRQQRYWQSVSSCRGRFIVPAYIYSPHIRNLFETHSMVFATCSLSVCYIFAIQKYGFCVAKVWFLSCKKGVFTLQKYGFCFLNVMLLQIGRNVFRG